MGFLMPLQAFTQLWPRASYRRAARLLPSCSRWGSACCVSKAVHDARQICGSQCCIVRPTVRFLESGNEFCLRGLGVSGVASLLQPSVVRCWGSGVGVCCSVARLPSFFVMRFAHVAPLMVLSSGHDHFRGSLLDSSLV